MIKAKKYDFDPDPMSVVGKHKDEPCFIVGAAPSVNQLDMKRLEGRLVIGINWPLKPPLELDPSYLSVADRPVWESESERIQKSETTLLLRRGLLEQEPGRPYYLFDVAQTSSERELFSLAPDLSVPFTGYANNSAVWALNWAYIFGCPRIYFIGVDFNLLNVKSQDLVAVLEMNAETHFFGNGRECGASSSLSGFNWPKLRPFFLAGFDQCLKRGQLPFNCSPFVGQFDVFPRKTFYEAILECDQLKRIQRETESVSALRSLAVSGKSQTS